ncbi:CPBP family intramembrane metalloprotease [Gulosibacter macacae]|uniref:CPBP family intramembrane metalloprotease n=1 Tax=Gulosibacter macacae TaxID=2488791 RepID=A0A3P3VWA1_9MICO|nr:CPBP family intramembrane glutamic endopeptidase [Gulosibacter macacae]RRJ87075.1 CPBP family intramembrane metalloprotease [Gulosibacter macacae]
MSSLTRPEPSIHWGVVPALAVSLSATVLFAFLNPWGYLLLAVGVAGGFAHSRALGRDLAIIGAGLVIVSSWPMEANLDWWNIVVMGAVLTAAVGVPFLLDRWWGERTIRFPLRRGEPWSRLERAWLVAVLVLGWLILPFYFIRSESYLNWPAVHEWHEVARLLIGVSAVGIWDELFFICTIFALYRRHFPMWTANVLQAIVFVSFLWELGYRSWGPVMTSVFALVQGWIFQKTRSLTYVICVHLLFDLVVFLVIVHAHNREWFAWFIY